MNLCSFYEVHLISLLAWKISSSSFFFLLLQWLTFYWAYFQFKRNAKETQSIIKVGKLYHGVVMCSHRQYCSEFFNQISEHFQGYFRLPWTDHSDVGIIGKIFSSCKTWVQMMSTVVKGDEIKSERRVNTCHSWLHPAHESMCYVMWLGKRVKSYKKSYRDIEQVQEAERKKEKLVLL